MTSAGTDTALLAFLRGQWGRMLAIVVGNATLAILALLAAHRMGALGAEPAFVAMDFQTFWAAGRLALAGDVAGMFDAAALDAARHGAVPEDGFDVPWLYPPTLLALWAPLALLPFATAWGLLAAGSLAAYWAALRAVVPGPPALLALGVLTPGILPTLVNGHVSLLWAAVLILAVLAHGNGRLVLAGVLIGLLTVKPQLGLLVPVALVAARSWTTVAAAAATTAALALAGTLLLGVGYWSLLADALAERHALYLSNPAGLTEMIGPYVGLRQLGLGHGAASALHWGTALVLAAAVWTVWRDPRAGVAARAAVLLAAAPLATPFAWYYDAVLMAPAAALMARAGLPGPGPASGAFLALLALNALPVFLVREYVALSYLCAPLGLIAALACARASLSRGAGPMPAGGVPSA